MYNPKNPPTTPPKAPKTSSSSTTTCCPVYARFEGSPNRQITVKKKKRVAYYAYDDRTNMASKRGSGEYWFSNPVGTHPSNRRTRDGSSWISVPVGQVAEVEIHMDRNKLSCLSNVSFRVDPANVASAVTTKVTARKAVFRIQGAGPGEATLIARCNGKDIGWFQIWCEKLVTLNLNVCTFTSARTSAVAISTSQAQTTLNKIFKQALIQFNVVDRGALTLNRAAIAIETAAFREAARQERPTGHSIWTVNTLRALLRSAMPQAWYDRGTRNYGYTFYNLNGREETQVNGRLIAMAGAVPALNDRFGVSFNGANYVTLAHEVGHMLGLPHPDGSGGGNPSSQLAAHLLASLNTRVPQVKRTNTDLAIPAEKAAANVMALDPQNLMGYSRNRANRSKLRIDQCKACSRV